MVEVVPFSGLLFNPDKTGPLDRVIAPPYDVISPEQQNALYQKSPYNIVRLILGKEYPEDNEKDNRYVRSAQTFRDWMEQKVLVPDARPGFYVYRQDYSFDGRQWSRLGFFARVRAEEFSRGNICPHEFTLAKAKKDRRLLLEACRANFSPVFGLFSDPRGAVDQKLLEATGEKPIAEIHDGSVTHRFWRLQAEAALDSISEQFKEKKIIIADGHHRYETALAYHKDHGHEVPDSAHVMMFLTNMESESLSIFPIHRMVKSPAPFDKEAFLTRVQEFFEVTPLDKNLAPEDLQEVLAKEGQSQTAFCVYLGQGTTMLLTLKDPQNILPFLRDDEPPELKVLDVAQLHAILLRGLLGIDTKNPDHQNYVAYTVDLQESMRRVDGGEFNAAFWVNPTRIEQVRRLAEQGIRLPQKATYFYPKLLSGLVINRFQP